MRALALVALLTACGASDGTHFADTETAEGSADMGSDAGTDGSLGAPTGGFDGEPRRQSSGDGLAAAGSSGLGTQPTGGSSDSGGAGGSSGGSTDGDSSDGSGGSGTGDASGGSSTSGSGGFGSDGSGGSGADGSGDAGGSSDSTTGAQGAPCAEPLAPQTGARNGSSGPFGTTEGVCYRVEFAPVQEEAHWACPGAADRSLTINGVPFDCSGLPLPAQPIDGAYYFEFGPGDNAEAYLIWKIWNAL